MQKLFFVFKKLSQQMKTNLSLEYDEYMWRQGLLLLRQGAANSR